LRFRFASSDAGRIRRGKENLTRAAIGAAHNRKEATAMATRNLESEFDVLKDDLVKLRGDIANLSSALKETTSETVREQVGKVRGRIDEITGDARAHGRQTIDELADHIEDRPLASVLVAFGVGILLGRLLDR
jgi:ElaB/YqjD/DUF883 family membrane-anchored ribosome-binding protein